MGCTNKTALPRFALLQPAIYIALYLPYYSIVLDVPFIVTNIAIRVYFDPVSHKPSSCFKYSLEQRIYINPWLKIVLNNNHTPVGVMSKHQPPAVSGNDFKYVFGDDLED